MLNINDKKISIWYLSNECTNQVNMQKKKFNMKEMIISYKNMLNEWKLLYIYIYNYITMQFQILHNIKIYLKYLIMIVWFRNT